MFWKTKHPEKRGPKERKSPSFVRKKAQTRIIIKQRYKKIILWGHCLPFCSNNRLKFTGPYPNRKVTRRRDEL